MLGAIILLGGIIGGLFWLSRFIGSQPKQNPPAQDRPPVVQPIASSAPSVPVMPPATRPIITADIPVEEFADDLDEYFYAYGRMFGVDPLLLRAVATHESGLNPNAINTADNESIGVMQILCRPDGKGGCTNRLPAIAEWSRTTRKMLFDPETNIRIGAQILAVNIRDWGFPRGIAVYNSWSARSAPINGPFPNQAYVNSVMAIYSKLQRVR